MEDWPVRLAEALGEDALSAQEVRLVLDVARDVAHGTERRYAPLSTFVLGLAIGRRAVDPVERAEALATLSDRVSALLPDQSA